MTDSATQSGDATTLEIIETLHITGEVADEIGGEFDDDLGLIKDHTHGSGYHLVRWNDASENNSQSGHGGTMSGTDHTDPLYYLRQAIRYADGEEAEIMEKSHNEIVNKRGENSE